MPNSLRAFSRNFIEPIAIVCAGTALGVTISAISLFGILVGIEELVRRKNGTIW